MRNPTRLRPILAMAMASTLTFAACGGQETFREAAVTQSNDLGDAEQKVDSSNAADSAADGSGDENPATNQDETSGEIGSEPYVTTADSDSPDVARNVVQLESEDEEYWTMESMGIDPDSDAGKCMTDNQGLLGDEAVDGDRIYVAALCAPAELAETGMAGEGLGVLTLEESHCVITELLIYTAKLPEAEARALLDADRLPAEHADVIVPLAGETCDVDTDLFAEEFVE